jgi:hypothetical protein
LPIPKWKWEVVTMDFITGFPRKRKLHDSIMVVVDKLTKVAHFIPLKTIHKEEYVVDIFMKEVARLHGIPKMIVSDRDPKFTSNFWKGLFKGFRMNMNFITTYHPKSDGQTERVNRVIEYMLRIVRSTYCTLFAHTFCHCYTLHHLYLDLYYHST